MITKTIYNFNEADKQLHEKNEEQDVAIEARLKKDQGKENAGKILAVGPDGNVIAVEGEIEEFKDFLKLNSMTEGSDQKFLLGISDDGAISVFRVTDDD